MRKKRTNCQKRPRNPRSLKKNQHLGQWLEMATNTCKLDLQLLRKSQRKSTLAITASGSSSHQLHLDNIYAETSYVNQNMWQEKHLHQQWHQRDAKRTKMK